MPVGELFLSAFIQVLFQQLASGAAMALARREKIESHFSKLSDKLSTIQAVLDDAEEKQLEEKSVKLWLQRLRDMAYDLDDLLDEIITRASIQIPEDDELPAKTSVLGKIIPCCKRFAPGTILSNYRIMSKIKELTHKLQNIVDDRIGLNLQEKSVGCSRRPLVNRLPTTHFVNESEVYGRHENKEDIIEMLLGRPACHDKVSVITIIGMGGIGKTTLAQLVYNDKKVKENFHHRAWVCVSEDFDVISITKKIYEAVTKTPSEFDNLEMLQVQLEEKLANSKFLIILDDVWNESNDSWDTLCRPLQCGLPGSKTIVTTRLDQVAAVVRFPDLAYHMKLLTEDDCLQLLALHAGISFNEEGSRELIGVGLELAKKCKGLPLAAKTLGGIVRFKDAKVWEDVLNSKLWDLPLNNNNILPVLRLSYHYLPPHLKHLFAYCSIFPKDYEFNKKELVLLWMGEGFLEQVQPNTMKTKEELGLMYFDELVSRSFFQRITDSSNFMMHDLINDLAQFVAGGTCYRLDEKMDTSQEYRMPERTRHGSFLRHEYEVFRKFQAFYRVRGLRTFLPMPVQNSLVWPPFYLSNRILEDLVPELKSLRVLSLSGYSITELPGSVRILIHLRYLNLSGTSIVALPETVSYLIQLQTLSLSNCRYIYKLPPSMGNLSNLRHLDNSNTEKLKDIPAEIGNLKNLQTLPKVVLSKDGGLGLKELGDLECLSGTLAIFELQNVTDIEDVKEANMRGKKDLEELQLVWGSDSNSSSRNRNFEEEVIELLQPHENLKSVKIEFYGGLTFPSWIADPVLRQLSSVAISNCSECTSLPPLGQLPDLKHLRIGSMQKVRSIGAEFYGSGVIEPFPKLETLRLDDMPLWEEWLAVDGSSQIHFPCLQQLSIFGCGNLAKISPLSFPEIRELDVEKCNHVLLESFSRLDKLSYLKVEAIAGLSHLSRELMQSLSALEVLECCSCRELLSLWQDEVPVDNLTRLRRLVVADCSQLVSLGQGQRQVPCNIEVLELFRCAKLESLPAGMSYLVSLREVIIKNCTKFIGFQASSIPPMLKRLEILSCNALESLPGDIANLERLEIKECSSLRTWEVVNFPATLKKLAIKNCKHLEPVSDAMFSQNNSMLLEDLSLCTWPKFDNLLKRLHGFSHLVELALSSCQGLRHFPEEGLPPALRTLTLEGCKTLKSLPAKKMSTMKSVSSIEIRSCPKLDSFPGYGLPPNLSSLRIWDSKKFKPLDKWGLHRLKSLREFSICGGFKEVELLCTADDCLFPKSLIRLSIARFPKLTSLSKVLENLTSLRYLAVMNCENLNDLPSEARLRNLWCLEISDCRLLKQRCLREKNDYWPKISGIPCVKFD